MMVPGYKHVPGNHCGSTALRNLLAFHGCAISEEMAFGLGAGACFFYFPLEDQSPSRFTNGRAARLEENFLELTGAPLRMRTDEDQERSWRMARENVDAGRPALLLTAGRDHKQGRSRGETGPPPSHRSAPPDWLTAAPLPRPPAAPRLSRPR